MFSKFIASSIRRGYLIANLRYPHTSQKMSSCISDKGTNIDDPDEIEKSLESDYNKMFHQSYLNHQQKINTPKQEDADINDIGEIESYEKLYLDSFNAHKLKEKVNHFESKTSDPLHSLENTRRRVVGRIYLGSKTLARMETMKLFTEAEIAGIMAAKKTAGLIPAHMNTIINKVELSIIADWDTGEAEVRVSVDSEGSGVTEAMVACTTALVTLMDFGVKDDPDTDIAVREIRLC